jgi:hypothetical protein
MRGRGRERAQRERLGRQHQQLGRRRRGRPGGCARAAGRAGLRPPITRENGGRGRVASLAHGPVRVSSPRAAFGDGPSGPRIHNVKLRRGHRGSPFPA